MSQRIKHTIHTIIYTYLVWWGIFRCIYLIVLVTNFYENNDGECIVVYLILLFTESILAPAMWHAEAIGPASRRSYYQRCHPPMLTSTQLPAEAIHAPAFCRNYALPRHALIVFLTPRHGFTMMVFSTPRPGFTLKLSSPGSLPKLSSPPPPSKVTVDAATHAY